MLITGESGTGKELVARAIHRQGPRRDKPFVAVNCAAIPEALIESELFGHERGAFTGAYQRKLGKFELAAGRHALPRRDRRASRRELQAKLLRVLQEREIERVGGTRRIRARRADHRRHQRDLKRAVGDPAFREDLYYRLNVVPIAVPPLRSRREDIGLAGRSLHRASTTGSSASASPACRAEALATLTDYDWPGNVRELQNIIERSVALVESPSSRSGICPWRSRSASAICGRGRRRCTPSAPRSTNSSAT